MVQRRNKIRTRLLELQPRVEEFNKLYRETQKEINMQAITLGFALAMKGGSPKDMAAKDNFLAGTLKSLFAVAEAYPDLKANENFVKLQAQFQQLENDIESARRYFNAVVRDFNIAIESFPSNIIASMFAFKQEEFFQLDSDEERKPVKGDFSS